jgi:hypothetical protein
VVGPICQWAVRPVSSADQSTGPAGPSVSGTGAGPTGATSEPATGVAPASPSAVASSGELGNEPQRAKTGATSCVRELEVGRIEWGQWLDRGRPEWSTTTAVADGGVRTSSSSSTQGTAGGVVRRVRSLGSPGTRRRARVRSAFAVATAVR